MTRKAGPYFIRCQNPKCQRLKQVRTPYHQRRRKFCSHSCAMTVIRNITREASRRGGLTRARRIRERLVHNVGMLTPLEAFRLGYVRGLQSKLRQIRRKYRLVEIAEGGA